MSGGGSVPNAPNLSAQTANANQAFNTATSNAAQTMNTAQAYNQNAQSTLSNVNAAQTPMMQSVNQTAQNNLNTYNNTFSPLQAQQAQQAQQYGSEANTNQLQGMAVADQNSQLQSQLNNQRQALAAEGVDPASVHGSALTQQAAVQGAANNAQAATQSALNTQNTARQLVANANQLGLQVGQQGTGGAQAGAGIGSGMVQNTNQTNATGVNNLTAANTYLNTGVNANQSAANIQNSQFQDQMQQYQAQQAANSSTLSSIGSIAGAAAMFMAGGGVVPDTKSGLMGAASPPVAPFSGGGVLPRQLPNNYDQGGPVGGMDPLAMQMQAQMAQPAVSPMNPGAVPVNTGGGFLGSVLPSNSPIMQNANAPAGGQMVQPQQGAGGLGALAGSLGKMAGFQQGGPVSYASGGPVGQHGALPVSPIPGSTDTKPAMLTPGEFVIPKDVAAWKGHEYWYKEMDKARQNIHQRHGLPMPVSAAMSARGH